jgi:hypothetical protein
MNKSVKVSCLLANAAFALLLASGAPKSYAGDAKASPAVAPAPSEPWAHALLQLDFSDHYITPRGLDVENRGLIFQPLLLGFFDLYHSKEGFLNDITLTLGVWSSFHTRASGADPGHWNEFDPIAGLAYTFGDWKLETNFTAFDSMVESYPTSAHFEAKLSFDDSKYLGAFSLHPYVAFWQELHEKATVVFNPATSDESNYFTIGIDPSTKIGPVKLEFPMYINLVNDGFYQKFDGSPGGSGLAVFGAEIKASVPLTFIPKDMGSWTLYAGVKYYHLNNQGLLDGNEVLTSEEHKKDLVQYHAGIAIFF